MGATVKLSLEFSTVSQKFFFALPQKPDEVKYSPVGLHHDDAAFEFSFAGAFEKPINTFLNPLSDLFLAAFLAYRAWDILDFKEIGLHSGSA
jgi:hypothetical protein